MTGLSKRGPGGMIYTDGPVFSPNCHGGTAAATGWIVDKKFRGAQTLAERSRHSYLSQGQRE